MGNCCWTQCFGRLRREAGRLQRGAGGGGSKYFRTCSRGEHLTIEFENLVESDEGESPGSSHRPLTEEEIVDLRERHYDSIAEKQKDLDMKIQMEGRQRAVRPCHPSRDGECQSSGPEDDSESCLRNIKSQYDVFRSSRLSSDATVLTPNTESSCDLMTKTKSTSGNDDSTSLDLEWEDEEGMHRMLPMRERSRTEEDILRAALKGGSRKTGSQAASASDDSSGLEWESDFVRAEADDNGNSEYAGFVNPVLELSGPGTRQGCGGRAEPSVRGRGGAGPAGAIRLASELSAIFSSAFCFSNTI
uniref:Adaptor related protein complex 1 associated regulatory protein n=1 Tax=Rousettus aegyptiacus TaxID=9407 RepID=A0A7J8BPV8_ROUAE|nr:adaptor related protein complex 1 associated regulatory protein [Rousettus aegyptiacus]